MKHLVRLLAALPLLAFSVLSFGGSAHGQSQENPPSSMLSGVTWQLVTITNSGQADTTTVGQGITIKLDDQGQVSGTSPCNSFGGTYQAGMDGSISFSPLISTMRACAESDRQKLEGTYYEALRTASSYTLSTDGTSLTIKYQSGTLVFGNGTLPGVPKTGDAANSQANPASLVLPGLLLLLVGTGALIARRALQGARVTS